MLWSSRQKDNPGFAIVEYHFLDPKIFSAPRYSMHYLQAFIYTMLYETAIYLFHIDTLCNRCVNEANLFVALGPV